MLKGKNKFLIAVAGVSLGSFLLGINFPKVQASINSYFSQQKTKSEEVDFQKINDQVLPSEGFTLPISWGDMGPKLIKAGVIDEEKFGKAVILSDAEKKILEGKMEGPVTIDAKNSVFVVDFLWAIGLAQKSIIYDQGPMGTDYKKDVGNFASTGGWTLAKGDATAYLNKFDLIPLTADQQKRVAELAKNIYRPCCDNPTWFPDCNHGMAALAAIEMMVSKDLPDDEIYRNVLHLNSFWFPDSYLTIAFYFSKQGTSWDKVDAKTVLGKDFSSATGAQRVQSIVGPLPGHTVSAGSC